jgi:TonB family protein
MKSAMVGVLVILGCCLLAGQAEPDSPKPAKPGKIYHVGGDVKPPRAISSPQPILDDNKEKIGQDSVGKKVVKEGVSVLSIVIAEDGSVRSAKVLKSLDRDLDAKALEVVKQWKFEPATKKGVPVAVEMAAQVNFHLYK